MIKLKIDFSLLMFQNQNNEYYSLSHSAFVVPLDIAVKEQQAIIEDQQIRLMN